MECMNPLIWLDGYSKKVIAVTLVNMACCFLLTSVIAIVITFIASLNANNIKLIAQSYRILDKMHEGVIIVDKRNLRPKFSSQAAKRLLLD